MAREPAGRPRGRPTRVTVICPDVSENSLGRALLLADVLALDFEVDVVGTRFGRQVWAPAAGRPLHHVVAGGRLPMYARSAAQLLRSIRGDVVYAVKPLPTSYGLALLHRRRTGTPVVLDVDDDELAFRPEVTLRHPLRLVSAYTTPNGRPWARMTVARARLANAITVASGGLQARFGGTIVVHAKDTDVLRPNEAVRAESRRTLGFGEDRIVMFAGTPRPFKGIEDVARAVGLMRHEVRFVVAGADPSDSYVVELRRGYPELIMLPPFPADRLPVVLSASDVVVVPQRRDPRTADQLPSKLLDAMAMAKPIVASAVADTPRILEGGRGLLVGPGNVRGFAEALDQLFGDPSAAAAMGARAREWCVRHASYSALRPVLRSVVSTVTRGS